MSKTYAENPLAGLSLNERKKIMESLNSNSNSNSTTTSSFLGTAKQKQKKNSGPLPPVYARNPYPGVTMSDVDTNTNTNSNTFTVPEYKPSAIGLAFKQAVLNRMKQKEAARRYKSKYPPISARNPYPGLKLSNLNTNSNTNTNKTKNKARNKRVSFSPNTKQRKTRKLPKNCRTRA